MTHLKSTSNTPDPIAGKLNLETAKIHWEELQPHFARGAAVYVSPELDLIGTAELVAKDDSATIAKLMQQGQFGLVNEEQAQHFLANNQLMWAVVIAPWVLIQPITTHHLRS